MGDSDARRVAMQRLGMGKARGGAQAPPTALTEGQIEQRISEWQLSKTSAIQQFRARKTSGRSAAVGGAAKIFVDGGLEAQEHEGWDRICGSWSVLQLKKGHRF